MSDAVAFKPARVVLDTCTRSRNFREFARTQFQLFERLDFAALRRWVDGDGCAGTQADLETLLKSIPDSADRAPENAGVLGFGLGEDILGNLIFYPDQEGGPVCGMSLERIGSEDDCEAEPTQFHSACLRLCEGMLATGLYSAELLAGGEGECLPVVPMATPTTRIAVASRETVASAYDDPDAFWNAGWRILAEHGGRHLLVRGAEAAFGPDFLASIIEDHWAMARAAKPDRAVYSEPYVLPEEEPIYRAGAPRLHFIGYAEQEKLIEYSCALDPGEHIQGWEIYALFAIATEKKTTDGAPVETVRIVFLEEWAARQEKRPLLDIGCRVYHYDDDGALRELTD